MRSRYKRKKSDIEGKFNQAIVALQQTEKISKEGKII
jgi:hypothetical protein